MRGQRTPWRATTWRTTTALAAVLAILVPVGAQASPVSAGPATARYPGSPPPPGRGVTGVHPLAPRTAAPLRDDAATSYTPAPAVWPAKATVALPVAAPAGTAKVGARTRADGAPLWSQAVAGKPAPAGVRVQVLDRAATAQLGVAGVVVAVDAQSTGSVRLGVDYSGFATAYGGNYGSRLRLVQLPGCALTAPQAAACRTPRPIVSRNEPGERSVSTDLILTAADGVAAPMVLATLSDPGGDGGTAGSYAATSLSPSGTWTAGGNSGAFTYTYPIATPPATTRLSPKVVLGYDSSSVDGQTASTQAQAGWLGDGWSTPQSYIEQTFTPCKDKPEGTDSPQATADQCYAGQVLTLSLNGSSTALVWDGTKYKPKDDDGSVVTRVTNSGNGSGTHDEDYWTVTDRTGTVYSFGRNHLPGWTTGHDTHSVDTVPVYSAHSGDPCYNATWSSSWCTMAYRWNLDYVTDVHGGAMAYFYHQDTNYYARNGVTNTSYVRDSYLDHIDYGFLDGGVYGTPPNRIAFTTGDRCLSGTCQPLNDTTKANWPDVPYDLICASGGTCPVSPSFFSTVRLTAIAAQQYNTGTAQYVAVDSYAFGQTMPASGDGTSPTLWLDSITHTGNDTTAGGTSAISTPAVKFGAITLQNRVAAHDGLPVFNRKRIDNITTETGSVIQVVYDRPNPCTSPVTVDPAANTLSCYPVSWTPAGYTDPITDWFVKYAVTKVTVSDPTGGAPNAVTSYTYLGGAAWHYDDNEVVKAKYRKYGQFRGYAKVQVRTGDGVADRQTLAEAVYYRGMSKNNNTTVVNVTDSQGGVHEDVDQLAGGTVEATVYQGDGGPADSSTISSYWVSAATATRSRSSVGLGPLTANNVSPVQVWSRQRVTSGGATTWRYTETDTSYDASISSPTFALPTATYSHTVPADAAYDRCSTVTYAAPNTAKNLVGLVSAHESVSVACGGFTQGSPTSVPGSVNTLTAPASVTRPDRVISADRVFYDDPTFATTFPQTGAPSKGDITMVQTAADWTGGAYTWQTNGRASYDATYGRLVDSYDANANKTTTSYTTSAIGLTTAITVTNPLNQTATTSYDTLRGIATTTTDPNGIVTTAQYDALGRTTGVWAHSRPTTSAADVKYTYTLVQHQPGVQNGVVAVATDRLNESLGYIHSTIVYDAMLRPRQTQTPTPQAGRMVTDTFYDTRGLTTATYNGWWDPATTPNTTLVTAAGLGASVYNADQYAYDGLGRVIYDRKTRDNVVKSATVAVYNGDRTTIVPTATDVTASPVPNTGAVTTTVTVDPLGRTTTKSDYTTAPALTTPADTFTGTFTISGGTVTSAAYGYDGHGNQNTITQAASTWTTAYDLLGRVTARTDPDAGTSTSKYDPNGNLTETTDSRGKTVSYTYDPLDRRTAEYDSAATAQVPFGQPGANQLAKWVYDNSDGAITSTPRYPIGYQTSSTSYANGNAYTVRQKNINIFGQSTGTWTILPASEGTVLGTTWKYDHTYFPNIGLPDRDIYPTAQGGLPAENIAHTYTGSLMLPAGYGSSLAGMWQNASYDEFGRLNYMLVGGAPNTANITYSYDDHTSRLTNLLVKRDNTTPTSVDQQAYTYDLAGNITKQVSTRLGSAATAETQCFGYDPLRRLTDAWTATDNCATAPTTANHAMVGDPLGAASAYWTSWTLDDQSNRLQQIQHAITAGTDITTTSEYNGAGGGINQPHTLTGTTTTGGASGTATYRYDTAGNMQNRTTALGNQTLHWNDAGQLDSSITVSGVTTNTTTYIYDADGNLLLQKDPGQTTLYLPAQQITLNTTTGTATGVRYYTFAGGITGIRTGTGTTAYGFTIADPHNTASLRLDNTAQTPTWRQYTPYGAPRGTTTTWIDNRAFLNQPNNPYTGLTQLGARHYDPETGRFISPDPILQPADLQQLNGYSYAASNPNTYTDPSGLLEGGIHEAGQGGFTNVSGGYVGESSAEVGIIKPKAPPKTAQKPTLEDPAFAGSTVYAEPAEPVAPYYSPSSGLCVQCAILATPMIPSGGAGPKGSDGGWHTLDDRDNSNASDGGTAHHGGGNNEAKAEGGGSGKIKVTDPEPEAQPQPAGGGAGGGVGGGGCGGGGGGGDGDSDEGEWVDPLLINFSQRTVAPNNYVEAMLNGTWDWNRPGTPLTVIDRGGQLVSYDNRRLDAARQVAEQIRGYRVRVTRVDPDAPNPAKTSGMTWDQSFEKRMTSKRNRDAGGCRVPGQGLFERPTVL